MIVASGLRLQKTQCSHLGISMSPESIQYRQEIPSRNYQQLYLNTSSRKLSNNRKQVWNIILFTCKSFIVSRFQFEFVALRLTVRWLHHCVWQTQDSIQVQVDFRRWQVCKERFRDFVNSLSVAVDNNRRCSIRNRHKKTGTKNSLIMPETWDVMLEIILQMRMMVY